ncbi:hypothetical protein CRUP_028441 [Coryphaenoides rupestris]|nr:hypothetical protein CRUP_028441 [Coryphaenoides rupestris]
MDGSNGPPSPPDTVTVDEVTDNTAQLTWSPARDHGSPVTVYLIQTRNPYTVGWQRVSTVPEVIDGSTLTATVVELNAWVEYEFRVLAKNGVGVGAPSPVTARTRTEDAVPDAAPLDVSGGGGSRSELVITWEPPLNVEWTLIGPLLSLYWEPVVAMDLEAEVTGYQVSYRRQRHKEVTTLITANASAELSLPEDDIYVIHVRALSEGGLGPPSEPIHIHQISMSARGSATWTADVSPLSLILALTVSTFRSTS